MIMMSIENALNMFGIKVEEVEPEEVLSKEDLEMTKKILDNIDAIDNNLKNAIEAAKEMEKIEVEVLLDPVSFDSKPQGATIAGIVNRLPQNKVEINLEDLANAAINGQSWKASVLSGTNNASFVSSSLVALDIDNKESYTSVDEFMAMNHKYQPCFIYETFSSTEEHNRFRAVYAFDDVTYDFNTMVALYNEVKAQYPTVDIDESVDPGKILFGGKALRYFNNVANSLPELAVGVLESVRVSSPTTPVKELTEAVSVDVLNIGSILKVLAPKYEDIEYIDKAIIRNWVNKNIKMSDILNVEVGARFRCVLPDHEDKHPSARIIVDGDEEVYMCTCEACGYRLTTLLSELLEQSEIDIIHMLLDNLDIKIGSDYQRMCERYLNTFTDDIKAELKTTIVDYLQRRKLYGVYNLVVQFAKRNRVLESFSEDNTKIVFFLSKRYLAQEMKDHNMAGSSNASAKLNALCELGLLRKLTDSELKQSVLDSANKRKKALSANLGKGIEVNRTDFYELVKMAPSVRRTVESRIAHMKDNAVRQRFNNIDRRINVFGIEEVTNNIHVQSTVNANKLNATRAKLETIISNLLASNKYFSEADLMKAYKATDTKHITKADAEQTVLDFIPVFLAAKLVQRVRVNKTTRKQHNISSKYQSNSFVYIAAK